jgi:hypothetical protein
MMPLQRRSLVSEGGSTATGLGPEGLCEQDSVKQSGKMELFRGGVTPRVESLNSQ